LEESEMAPTIIYKGRCEHATVEANPGIIYLYLQKTLEQYATAISLSPLSFLI
jgi:uncharacterized protein with von Willebrand factor type A (vWA) domain